MNIKEIIDSNFRGNIYIVQNNRVLCECLGGNEENTGSALLNYT